MTKITERAMLMHLQVSMWTANKRDVRASNEVCSVKNTARGMARVNKSLLPPGALDKIEKIASGTRAYVYDNTLPWMHDGPRILPNEHYMTVAAELRARIPMFDEAVRELVANYDELCAQARRLLGALYDPTDYPAKAEIASRFSMDTIFAPLPDSGDFRTTLVDDAMKAEWDRAVQRTVANATDCLWERLYEVVKRASERLSQPDAIFRDTLVENARELCAVLPKLNITGDPNLEAMRQEVERTLGSQKPDTLRHNPGHRAATASKLDDVMRRMAGFYSPA